ncbi:hypothetical protein quinque_003028 [Culex quinquefasciatus]
MSCVQTNPNSSGLPGLPGRSYTESEENSVKPVNREYRENQALKVIEGTQDLPEKEDFPGSLGSRGRLERPGSAASLGLKVDLVTMALGEMDLQGCLDLRDLQEKTFQDHRGDQEKGESRANQVRLVYEVLRVFLELVQMIVIWQQLQLLKVCAPISKPKDLIIEP